MSVPNTLKIEQIVDIYTPSVAKQIESNCMCNNFINKSPRAFMYGLENA